MPLIRCTNVFYKGDYPVTLLPPPRRLAPSLGLGTTWVRQLRSGSCSHPTSDTKCNVLKTELCISVYLKLRKLYYSKHVPSVMLFKRLYRGLNEMSHTKSTALERLVIQLLGGLNRFYGIPTLALGLGVVHTRRFRNNV